MSKDNVIQVTLTILSDPLTYIVRDSIPLPLEGSNESKVTGKVTSKFGGPSITEG
ncbi:hypothetical protein KY285_035724 [Solanum tuberosum]|nr:hypothetical protein KY285_035724 [Solanum tuberosum]